MKAPELTAEQVRAWLGKARGQADRVPAPLRPAALAGLAALEGQEEDLARLGSLGALRALAWWSAVDPFSDPPSAPVGRDAALGALTASGDRLQDAEDQEREALRRLKAVAVEVGLAALRVAVPLLLAAL